MKYFLLTVLVSGIAIVCKPQSAAPVGFGNTYTYSEADGFDESTFFVRGIASDGRVFFHSNVGSLFIKGNNYTRKIRLPTPASAASIEIVLEAQNNQFVAFTNRFYYYVIEKDSLTKIGRFLEAYVERARIGNELIAASGTHLYHFEKDSFVCKLIVPDVSGSTTKFFSDENNKLWRITNTGDKFDYYRINDLWEAEYQFTFYNPPSPQYIDTIISNKHVHVYLTFIGNISDPGFSPLTSNPHIPYQAKFSLSPSGFQHSILTDLRNRNKERLHILYTNNLLDGKFSDNGVENFYLGSSNKPFRYFPLLKKYPMIFDHVTSAAINAITQDSSGRIWVASYEGGLSIIDKNEEEEYRKDHLIFLPGSFSSRNHVYLISESTAEYYERGLLQYGMHGKHKGLSSGTVGYYATMSKDKQHFYFGTPDYQGLWISDMQSLESGKPNWKKIDSTYGNRLRGIITITEDFRGRIWFGGTASGFAIYYPDKEKASTWLVSKNETTISFGSCITDDKGTVWLGTGQRGLMYYNDNSGDTVDEKKIFKIEHPMLPEGTRILFMKLWGKWLIMGTRRDVLMMDLEKWYDNKKIFIRYLNPQEGNFTASCEQNTVVIDKRDSTVWFATSDMLYQWDIKKWFSLPTYIVKPNLVFHTKNGDSTIIENKLIKVKPTKNSLKFSVWFQSPDNMPRYMSVALIKKGDSLIFPVPSLQTQFQYDNLAPGNYELVIQICQSDGSVSVDHYPFLIKKFWWQYWWVWAFSFLLLFIPVTLWIISRNRAKLVEEKAKRREAEQQKKLSALQIISLGNQFRPHFILNALNTVGAELDNKPQAESVLSRLGESIDLIFNHSQQQKIAHSIVEEWKLVKNVIDIHRMMYLKQLETDITGQLIIDRFDKILIPLGLLQIPVENALLHGLSNREAGPWNLVIDMDETEKELIVTITDNGVGRLKAATLSNFRKHGTGTKNLNSILEIVNKGKPEKIKLDYLDDIFCKGEEHYGTKVIITIPKNFQYEIG